MKIKIEGIGVVEVSDGFAELSEADKQRVLKRIVREQSSSKSSDETSYLGNLARTGIGQGLLLGFGDEIEAGLMTGFGTVGDYGKYRENVQQNLRQFSDQNPKAALAAELGGALATGAFGGARLAATKLGQAALKKAGVSGLGATTGAIEGTVAGVGSGNGVSGRTVGGLTGGALGGTLGGVAPAAIKAGSSAVNRALYATGMKSGGQAETAAQRKALQKLEAAGKTPDQVSSELAELREMGVTDSIIADVSGDPMVGLARASAVSSDEGREFSQKVLNQRAMQMGDEIASDVSNVLAGGKTSAELLEEIAERQSSRAASQYDLAFNMSGKPVLVEVDDKLKGLLSLPAFDEAVEQASNLARLEGFSLPSAKDIISGNKIENISLREMHFIKMGIDEVLGLGKRGQSKTAIGRGLERGLKNARAEFIDILDEASPKVSGESSYKVARNSFAGDARLREAAEEGRKALKKKTDEVQGLIKKMSESEKEAFRIGVSQAISDTIESSKDMSDLASKMFSTPKNRNILEATFPDKKSFSAFEKRMEARKRQAKVRAKAGVAEGSRTQVLNEEMGDLGSAAQVATRVLAGDPTAAAGLVEKLYSKTGMPQQVGGVLSRELFSTSPSQQEDFLRQLTERRAMDEVIAASQARRYGAITGGAGSYLGLDETPRLDITLDDRQRSLLGQ